MENFKKLDMQKHVRVKLQTNTCTEKPLLIGDPPSLLNTTCANWTDVVVVDGKCYDKEAVAKLLAERAALSAHIAIIQDAWLSAGGWPDTIDEKQRISDAIYGIPKQQDQFINEIRAEAISEAVNARPEKVAHVEHFAQTNSKGMHCDIWLSSSDLINYANKVRKGGEL